VLAATCPGKYSSGTLGGTQAGYADTCQPTVRYNRIPSLYITLYTPYPSLAQTVRVSPSVETPYVGLGDPGTTADRTSVEKTPSAQTYPTYSGGAVWADRPI